MRVNGYETVEVFVESVEVVISNVVSKSSQPRGGRPDAYEAAPIRIGEPYYVDRDYTIGVLPDFLTGLHGIKTSSNQGCSLRGGQGGRRPPWPGGSCPLFILETVIYVMAVTYRWPHS